MSRFIDAKQSERCQQTIELGDGSTAQCGRRQTGEGLCTQHRKMKESTKHPIHDCNDMINSLPPEVRHDARLELLGYLIQSAPEDVVRSGFEMIRKSYPCAATPETV